MGFASLQSLWAFYIGILAETPNPFPVGRAVYAWLALRPAKPCGIHARHPCRGYITGATAQSKQGRLQSAAQSRCARTHNDSHTKPLHDATAQMAVNAQMQWHKWLTTCTGATPQSKDALVACQKFCTMQNQQSKQHSTSHFQKSYRFFDSQKRHFKAVYIVYFTTVK